MTIDEGARAGIVDGEQEGDPILAALHRAEDEYEKLRARLVEQEAALVEAVAANTELRDALERHQGLLEQERRKTRRERIRTKEVAAQLREIHAALFSGNLYDLIPQILPDAHGSDARAVSHRARRRGRFACARRNQHAGIPFVSSLRVRSGARRARAACG